MKLSKLDVAVIQFEAAILAYKSGRYIEAITLGGAAELLLGKMCELLNKKTAKKSYIDIAKTHDANLIEKNFSDYLNKHKNWLKHFNENDEFAIDLDLEDAKAMLVRATINYLRLGLVPTKLMNEFITELGY